MKFSQTSRRVWRGAASVRRVVTRQGSARPALRAFGNPRRVDADHWMGQTSAAHADYRSRFPPASGRVAVVCVSQRPGLVDDVVANIGRQVGIVEGRLDIIYLATFDEDLGPAKRAFAKWPFAIVEQPGTPISLGSALNLAMAKTDARFVAKFDDDDLYGPNYLADSLRAHHYSGAGVVGKHTYYARFAGSWNSVLRFPGNEFRYTSTLAGGTLVIDRAKVGEQQFDDISLGEDQAFIAACHRRGISTFSADRFNFIQIRSGSNTWRISEHDFLHQTLRVDETDERHTIFR